MKIPKPFLVLLFCLLLFRTSYAEVFQYFDEEGTLIVTDNPFGTKKRDRPQYQHKQKTDLPVRLNFREDVAYEFYAVSGKDIHDAMAETDRVGPLDPREGRHYAGQTRWNFGLSYNTDFSYNVEDDRITASVHITDIDFRSDITVILPSLAENSDFAAPDFKMWEDFLQQLAAHEHDHVRIIREPRFRQEVIDGISGIRELTLPRQSDENAEAVVKSAIESEVGLVAHGIMRKIKQKNDEYDTLTDHGRKPDQSNNFFQRL